MNLLVLGILVAVNIPVYLVLGHLFFRDWRGVLESFVAIFESDASAAFSGRYEEHRVGKFTLVSYVVLILAMLAAEYHVVAKFILGIEKPWG